MVRIEGLPEATVAVVDELRRSDAVGNVVVLRAPTPVKAQVDVWGAPGDAEPVMRAIKQALDPSGILNAGRGPV
jgi:glycolate oxidase FAD binding subunit